MLSPTKGGECHFVPLVVSSPQEPIGIEMTGIRKRFWIVVKTLNRGHDCQARSQGHACIWTLVVFRDHARQRLTRWVHSESFWRKNFKL